MATRVIQGFFIGGRAQPSPGIVRAVALQRKTQAPAPTLAGPPAPAHAGRGAALQRFGGAESFEIDTTRLGLARGGGRPLPTPLLAKMESALGADFSAVRVHVGPQAPRIGAVAFTTGNDIYFAPGRYQPDSMQGQQLIGHELAHVVQQRQGRVRTPVSGVAIVQDRALEAEADRMGMRAAMQRMAGPAMPIQRRTAPVPQSRFPASIQRVSSFASTKTYDGQIYGIWKNPQYPKGKIKKTDMDMKKVLYIGKTVDKQDVGARFISHASGDKDKPWFVCSTCSYDSDDDEEWPFVVRELYAIKELTKFDIAVAEQYYIDEHSPPHNKIDAISRKKYMMFKDDPDVFTTKSEYPKSYKPGN